MTVFHWIYFVAIPAFMAIVASTAMFKAWRDVRRGENLRKLRQVSHAAYGEQPCG